MTGRYPVCGHCGSTLLGRDVYGYGYGGAASGCVVCTPGWRTLEGRLRDMEERLTELDRERSNQERSPLPGPEDPVGGNCWMCAEENGEHNHVRRDSELCDRHRRALDRERSDA